MPLLNDAGAKRILSVSIDHNELKAVLDDVERKAVKVTKDNTTIKNFAWALIKSAYKITPYRDEYVLRKRKKVKDRTKRKPAPEGSGKKYVYGNKYISTGADKRKYTHKEDDEADLYHKKAGSHYRIKTPHREEADDLETIASLHKWQSLRLEDVATRIRKYAVTPEEYHKSDRFVLQSQLHEKAAAKYFAKADKYRKDEKMVADRPPHLRDSYSVTKAPTGAVSISYSVKKPQDDQFAGESNVDYANKQYYTQDIKWHRHTPGTAGRWLEQAVGIDVGSGYQKAKINGKANYQKLLKAFEKDVRKQLQKK